MTNWTWKCAHCGHELLSETTVSPVNCPECGWQVVEPPTIVLEDQIEDLRLERDAALAVVRSLTKEAKQLRSRVGAEDSRVTEPEIRRLVETETDGGNEWIMPRLAGEIRTLWWERQQLRTTIGQLLHAISLAQKLLAKAGERAIDDRLRAVVKDAEEAVRG